MPPADRSRERARRQQHPVYDANPLHDIVGGEVITGWDRLAAEMPAGCVLALDGPAAVDWARVVEDVCAAVRRRGMVVGAVDARDRWRPWSDVLAVTSSAALAGDPNFERLADGRFRDLVDTSAPVERVADGVLVVAGPGAALVQHDVLWYVDLPKRFAEADVAAGRGRNLGQRAADGPVTTKRLFYVDWPLLDAHRDELLAVLDRWVDVQDPLRPAALDGTALRRTLAALAYRPMRTRPTFNTTPWGGQWARRELGVAAPGPNTALGYELIAPESGVLVGDATAQVELPFQLVVAAHPVAVLGERVHEVFGTSFPIRFDYLDTVDGGNLSVHCHPRSTYMRDVFGWPYTQHETYYVVVGGPDREVFLGLRDGVDVDQFRAAAVHSQETGERLEIRDWVQTFPAEQHQLFCIPAGTPHGSGAGNVVLEVSATPYLYSLRFYDWLRRGAAGRQRPVHVEHAFANLDSTRTGDAVATDLVPAPGVVREGPGWREEVLGALPEMFFEVRRIVLNDLSPVPDDSGAAFHVLNVVDGPGVEVSWPGGRQVLARAETLVVPAAVGPYQLQRLGSERTRVVKAVVA